MSLRFLSDGVRYCPARYGVKGSLISWAFLSFRKFFSFGMTSSYIPTSMANSAPSWSMVCLPGFVGKPFMIKCSGSSFSCPTYNTSTEYSTHIAIAQWWALGHNEFCDGRFWRIFQKFFGNSKFVQVHRTTCNFVFSVISFLMNAAVAIVWNN